MKRKLLSGVFVDRFSITCVKLTPESSPSPVKTKEEILALFEDDPAKYEIVSQILLGKCFTEAADNNVTNME